MIRILVLALLPGLAGCHSAPQHDPASRYYVIPVGSTIELRKAVTIPPNTAHINLQYGKLVDDRDRDLYYPHCRFEISDLSDEPRVIQPDTFRITRVVNRTWVDSKPDLVDYITKLWIHSDRTPDVLYMYCAQYNTDPFPDWVTIAGMQEAWGEYFTIHLEDQPDDRP